MSSSRRASHQCQQLLLDVQRYDVELAGGFVHHGLLGADLVLARSGSFGPSPLSPALILAVVEIVGSPAGAGSLPGHRRLGVGHLVGGCGTAERSSRRPRPRPSVAVRLSDRASKYSSISGPAPAAAARSAKGVRESVFSLPAAAAPARTAKKRARPDQ